MGCSGWSYKDWRGIVYPAEAPARTWFSLYAERFDTVEINNTFYRLPTQTTVEGWAAQAPPGFCYSLKVGQFGSHRMKLRDAASWLPNHLDRVERLGTHLGPNVLQLPPRWRRQVGRLEEFLEAAPASLRWAVELRDPTWLHDDVFAVLARHGAALVLHDLLPQHPWVRTTDWTYIRFHGPRAAEEPYRGRYGGRRLAPVARRLLNGSTTASTSTPTSTTTTKAMPWPTRSGWQPACHRRHGYVRRRARPQTRRGAHGPDRAVRCALDRCSVDRGEPSRHRGRRSRRGGRRCRVREEPGQLVSDHDRRRNAGGRHGPRPHCWFHQGPRPRVDR